MPLSFRTADAADSSFAGATHRDTAAGSGFGPDPGAVSSWSSGRASGWSSVGSSGTSSSRSSGRRSGPGSDRTSSDRPPDPTAGAASGADSGAQRGAMPAADAAAWAAHPGLPRPVSRAEELANAGSHGLGLLLALASALAPEASAADRPELGLAHPVMGERVFLLTMLAMYAVSTAYHLAPVGRLRVWLRRFDHAVIYLFIAGTFTPYALAGWRIGEGWLPLALAWGIAIAGAGLKLAGRLRRQVPSTLLYLAYGWLVVLAARAALDRLPEAGLTLLVAGGLAYTVGTVFFLLDRRLPYGHLVWHGFVMLGTFCHVMALSHLGI